MISIIADNIISPLGFTTADNLKAVVHGDTRLCLYQGKWGIPEPFVASLFTDEQWNMMPLKDGYSRLERLAIFSIGKAVSDSGMDITSSRVIIILSSTKGDVEQLPGFVSLGETATRIARYFKNPNIPVVVSNACISGLSAQIVARRMLQTGDYDYAVVCGVEVQSKFIISGFQSFKALSVDECRPFDIDRNGLNVGEAAATVIMKREEDTVVDSRWYALDGVIRNDAFHISSPSRTANGSYNALSSVLRSASSLFGENAAERLGMVNVHGTSTLYNDEMESVALSRAGLDSVPINTYKGYYGHTMGAAGILEVVLSMHSLAQGLILGTRGFRELGVSHSINVSSEERYSDRAVFIKLISGFGGCNAAMLFAMGKELGGNRK